MEPERWRAGEKISWTCQQEPKYSNAEQAVQISWGGKAHLHTQGEDGADCILFLNGFDSLKLAASIVQLSDDLKHLQLSDALIRVHCCLNKELQLHQPGK